MPRYKVHYWRDVSSLLHPNEITREDLPRTHALVTTLDAKSPDQVFVHLQDPPEPLATALTTASGTHTSMSVGDALEADDGTIHVCMSLGWRTIPPSN